jgi:glycine cleavage system H protein
MLEVTVDKFKFRVPEDLLYSDAGIWITVQGSGARLGLTDFAQQVNGDIAFANVRPAGTRLAAGDEFASIETVKVNLGIPAPVRGNIVGVNESLADAPELINQDPYGSGWLADVDLVNWDTDKAGLMDARAYLEFVRTQAESELKK